MTATASMAKTAETLARHLPEQILRVAPRQTPAAACDGMHRYQRHAQHRQRLTQMQRHAGPLLPDDERDSLARPHIAERRRY